MSTKPIGIETINLFLNSSIVKTSNSAVRSGSLKVKHDNSFENSKFVLTGLDSLQICIKIISCVEPSRHWLKF